MAAPRSPLRRCGFLLSLGLALPLVLSAQSPAARQRTVTARAEWLAAVRAHQPGTLDSAAREIAGWRWETLSALLNDVHRLESGADVFRAAVLYLDIAATIPIEDRPAYPTDGFAMTSNDGRRTGTAPLDPHLFVGRQLVRASLRRTDMPPELQALGAAWYRTAAAAAWTRRSMADLLPLLEEALARYPEHGGLLFEMGCLHETFASPSVQATVADVPPPTPDARSYQRPAVGSRSRHLGEAERYFRRALQGRDSDPEAAVRLGRILLEGRRFAEAVTQLESAPIEGLTPAARYYRLLFLGRSHTAAGDPDRGVEAYREAAALFPAALSPQLGISQYEAMSGRTRDARGIVASSLAGQQTGDGRTDPWWEYHYCTGRDADERRAAFAERVRRIVP